MDELETRTRELGVELLRRARGYRPTPAERAQDRLLLALSRDEELQRRLLGVVDVLSGLWFDGSGRRTQQLLHEYLGHEFPASPALVRTALRLATWGSWPSPLVARASRIGAGFMAGRFIVKPSRRAIDRVLRSLDGMGRYPSFDLLGEQVLSEHEADGYARRYLGLVRRLAPRAAGLPTPSGVRRLQVSLKLSSLTADFNAADPERTLRRVGPRLEQIAMAAREAGVAVTVDAEQYEYRDLGWWIFQAVFGSSSWRDWDGAGLVIQAYLADALDHTREVTAFARQRAPFQVRLVKGAYWDYEGILAQQRSWPCPVFQQKDATDLCFETVTRELIAAAPAVNLAVASHNLRSHAFAEAVREGAGLPVGAIEHQTLYRTAEGTSRALTLMGWPCRDYVPLGELLPAMAYLARRILENSSQSGFLLHARLGESEESLLRAPQPLEAPTTATPATSDEHTFVNHPPPRLFRAEDRERFAAAYGDVLRASDQVWRLDLGSPAGAVVDSTDPADGSRGGRVEFATVAHAQEAIRRARTGLAVWRWTDVTERARILLDAADRMAAERDRLAAWVVREGGKAAAEAYGDVDEAIDFIRFYALQAERLPGAGFHPRGIVAVIPPWNFPLAIPCGMVSAALATGNAVILKPAEETPIVARHLVDLLHGAGVPREALVWLPGEGESVGRALVESPDVGMVAFTGSRAVGEWIFRTCAATLTSDGRPKTALTETGGKNPVIVCADGDLDEAIKGVLRSAFAQANQKCSAASRVFVERPVLKLFLDRLREGAASLQVGPGVDFGTFIPPVISSAAADRIRAAAEVARREGTVVLDAMTGIEGTALGPLIVLVDPAAAATAHTTQEEIFGPILAMIPFDTIEEALHSANNVAYGLTAGVYTRSHTTMELVIDGLEAGNVYVNRETVAARVGIEPFGGRKLSGTGPKAGSDEYAWAFVTRTEQIPRGVPVAEIGTAGAAAPLPWGVAAVGRAARRAAPPAPRPAPRGAGLQQALDHLPEVAEPQAVREIPGQRSYVDWRSPRGAGIAAFGESVPGETIGAFVGAALLAGNGLTVLGPPVAGECVQALLDAGIPASSLRFEADRSALVALAHGAYHFAAGDLPLATLQPLRMALAENRPGIPAFRVWIGNEDGPVPGSPGFLRRFALPKAVAINTLRHAVDLGI